MSRQSDREESERFAKGRNHDQVKELWRLGRTHLSGAGYFVNISSCSLPSYFVFPHPTRATTCKPRYRSSTALGGGAQQGPVSQTAAHMSAYSVGYVSTTP